MKRTAYKAKTLSGAQARVRELENRIAEYREKFDQLYEDRSLLARLAADGPCFNNPLEAMAARKRRDLILSRQFRLNPDGTSIAR